MPATFPALCATRCPALHIDVRYPSVPTRHSVSVSPHQPSRAFLIRASRSCDVGPSRPFTVAPCSDTRMSLHLAPSTFPPPSFCVSCRSRRCSHLPHSFFARLALAMVPRLSQCAASHVPCGVVLQSHIDAPHRLLRLSYPQCAAPPSCALPAKVVPLAPCPPRRVSSSWPPLVVALASHWRRCIMDIEDVHCRGGGGYVLEMNHSRNERDGGTAEAVEFGGAFIDSLNMYPTRRPPA